MKKLLLATVMGGAWIAANAQSADWANHPRYAEANAQLTNSPEVVFMGNSITDGWDNKHLEFFTDNNFACRGISGQVTGQMLCRFYADVIKLNPKAVVILAGINDIAQNKGPIDEESIFDNIVSMTDLARQAGIRPFISSLLPCDTIPWNAAIVNTADKVRSLNKRLYDYALANGITYVDYYTPMTTERGGLDPKYSKDGVHPTRAGYDVMEPIVLAALATKEPACKKKCSKKDVCDGKKAPKQKNKRK